MAKIKSGSIAKKGKNYYLVYRNKWIALKTDDYNLAVSRAVDFLPGLADPDIEWLNYLVELGDKARQKLQKKAQPLCLSWSNLFCAWQTINKNLTTNPATLKSYRSQINALAQWCEARRIASPTELSIALIAEYLAQRSPENQRRDCAFFKRVFCDLGLDPASWDRKNHSLDVTNNNRFRRITQEEFERLLGNADAPTLRALLLLGYTTGLRLGTCLAITPDNVQGDHLSIVAGKTRRKKPRPLIVPLLPTTSVALDQVAPCYFSGLRSDTASKVMTSIFRQSKVTSNQFGLASFHSLRATFISVMDEAGISAHITDAITGHAPQGMHGRYTQPSRKSLMSAVRKAFPGF